MMTVIDIPAPHVLRSPEEYDAAVTEIDRLLDLDPQPFTEDYDRLELLSVLVEDYDARHNPDRRFGPDAAERGRFHAGAKGNDSH
jgi:HTH-type transcriptional regulator/antitoxin HigA